MWLDYNVLLSSSSSAYSESYVDAPSLRKPETLASVSIHLCPLIVIKDKDFQFRPLLLLTYQSNTEGSAISSASLSQSRFQRHKPYQRIQIKPMFLLCTIINDNFLCIIHKKSLSIPDNWLIHRRWLAQTGLLLRIVWRLCMVDDCCWMLLSNLI